MIKIDAHQHFWKYIPENLPWINQEMAVLKRDFLPEDLKELLASNGMDGCVAVQAAQNEAETAFLLQLANDHDFIRGVVGWVDIQSDDMEERLQHYASFEKLKGFRHILQDEADPDYILRPAFQRGLGILAQYGFTYDILIFPKQMEGALKTIEKFPHLRFVLDHIAKPAIKDRPTGKWKDYMMAMGNFPNVYCKLSGMVTEAPWGRWKREDFTPFLDVATEAFETDRLLYGSDWPVCLLSASYAETKGIVEHYLQHFPEEDKQKIRGENAVRFYQL